MPRYDVFKKLFKKREYEPTAEDVFDLVKKKDSKEPTEQVKKKEVLKKIFKGQS